MLAHLVKFDGQGHRSKFTGCRRKQELRDCCDDRSLIRIV